jgi:hypothetical protein
MTTMPAFTRGRPAGGVIVLDNAEAIDSELLELDPLNPPVERLAEQAAEDSFC